MNDFMKKIRYSRARKGKLSSDGNIGFPWADRFLVVATLILPFFVLYWMVPFISKYTIGNDYLQYWIRMQLFLQFSIKNGTFPLYAPSFNGGWTASALTLGQLWHPISWLAALLPGYWSGHAHGLGTLLRLFSLSGTHLALFLFLRRLRLARVLALVISFITVYNLRMLDMFRYGASLENYVAHLLLCVAIAWHYVTPMKRLGPFCIAICTWLLVVGGHPQITYFGLLGAAVVCLLTPFYMAVLLPDNAPVERRIIWKYYLTVGLSVAIGVLLASSYVLPFYFEYLHESSRSISTNFRWACGYQHTVAGGLCNFFNPFHSDVNGAFGGSALFLLAALAPLLFLFRVRIVLPVLFLWLIGVVVFVLTLGSNGPLYYYFWKYFPFAQSFRIPGRLALILPFIILMLLAWMAHLKPFRLRIWGRDVFLSPLALLATVAAALFAILNAFPPSVLGLQGGYPRYSPAKLNEIPVVVIVLTVAFGLASLAAIVLYCSSHRFRLVAGVVLITAVFFQVTATLRYGTWVAAAQVKTPTFETISRAQRQRLSFWGPSGDWSRSLIEEHLQQTFLEPTLARVCPKYTLVTSHKEAYEHMARERAIDYVFVENYPATEASDGLSDSDAKCVDRVELKYNSFNNAKFEVTCAQPAFFVFSYPYSERWRGYVDKKSVPIYRCNGIEQTIWLPAGRHTVEFRYWSWPAIMGAVLSCLAVLSIALFLLTGLRPKLLRRSAMVMAPCFCTLALLIWYHSLYQGANIGTDWLWTSKDVQPHLLSCYNLAYGKTTTMSTKGAPKSYSRVSSLGVDGQRDPRYGFITNFQERAWWQVDLGRAEPIAEIVFYKQGGRYKKCSLPFDIIVSPDGKHWSLVQTIRKKTGGDHWRIRLQGVAARYIRLQTRYRGCLALAEVEIYGPAPDSAAVSNKAVAPDVRFVLSEWTK